MLQHIVPQTYLKRFAIEDIKKKHYVFAYDKNEGKDWRPNINQIAAQNDYYQLKRAKNENEWEEVYSRFVEQDLNQLLTEMIKKYEPNVLENNIAVFCDRDRVRITLHVITQLFRGMAALDYEKSIRPFLKPRIRKEAEELAKQYCVDSAEVDRCLDDDDIWKISYARQAIIPSNHIALIHHLVNRNWILFRSYSDSFITSDSPILCFNQKNNLVGEFVAGIGSEATVVFYPISPRLLIGMYARDEDFPILDDLDNKMVFLSDKDSNFIDFVNLLQFRQCNRQVYAKSEDQLHRLILIYKQQVDGGYIK